MDEENEALRYVAEQQNLIDAITRRIYGTTVKFEHLSAFGQRTVETLARKESSVSTEARHYGENLNKQRAEIEELESRLADLLRENQELWEENESYRLEEMDLEDENSNSRRTRDR